MAGPMKNLLTSFLKPFRGNNADEGERRKGIFWYRNFGQCASGDFSMAVAQGNMNLEDQSQLESGLFGTFVGIYDGHGGNDAARYICDNLFNNFQALLTTETQGVVTEAIIRQAFLATEEGFAAHVAARWETVPNIATLGSCCLVGVIYHQTLYVGNLGDSRAVLGRKIRHLGGVAPIQLSIEHNVNIPAVKEQLQNSHANDPEIVVWSNGAWRVRGIIQVSRAIGDVCMKRAEYQREPLPARFRLRPPVNMPVLSADPSIISHPLETDDCFVIFASDGLWEHLSNQQAVDIVHKNPHARSAKRLIKAALKEAARKRGRSYSNLIKVNKINKVERRTFHDDISVAVLFFNHELIAGGSVAQAPLSVRCAPDHELP